MSNPVFEDKVLELLKNTPTLATTDYVAFHLHVNWATARSLLLTMSLKGQVKAIRTTRGFVFHLPNTVPLQKDDSSSDNRTANSDETTR